MATGEVKKRKQCTKCLRKRDASKFRVLSSGYLQGMCVDCEREYERDRWHNRSAASKASSGVHQKPARARAAA
jgi:hypothetical protein